MRLTGDTASLSLKKTVPLKPDCGRASSQRIPARSGNFQKPASSLGWHQPPGLGLQAPFLATHLGRPSWEAVETAAGDGDGEGRPHGSGGRVTGLLGRRPHGRCAP